MDRLYYDLDFRVYSFKIAPPYYEKKGVILSWLDENRKKHLADISPLKGFSKESFEEVLEILKKPDFFKNETLPNSLDFALNHPIIIGEQIKPKQTSRLILSEGCLRKNLTNFKTLKFKVHGFTNERLIDHIKAFSSTHDIRLDANRKALDPKFRKFLLDHPEIYRFIEEPKICDPDDKKLKIALDETLYLEKKIPDEFIPSAIVYKPTLAGSIFRIKPFLDLAIKKNIPIIVSSSFESEIGLLMLMKLMDQINCNQDGGLDTFLEDHLFENLSFNPPQYIPCALF